MVVVVVVERQTLFWLLQFQYTAPFIIRKKVSVQAIISVDEKSWDSVPQDILQVPRAPILQQDAHTSSLLASGNDRVKTEQIINTCRGNDKEHLRRIVLKRIQR